MSRTEHNFADNRVVNALFLLGKIGEPQQPDTATSFCQLHPRRTVTQLSGYDVFERRPSDFSLIDPALKNHEELFGSLPTELAAARGFHEHSSVTEELEKKIPVVSIAKSGGHRNQKDRERESTLAFKLAQAFRAGVEGSISYLKRALRMFRCLNKGWEHYVSTVGATILTHNLLVLARSY